MTYLKKLQHIESLKRALKGNLKEERKEELKKELREFRDSVCKEELSSGASAL